MKEIEEKKESQRYNFAYWLHACARERMHLKMLALSGAVGAVRLF